VRVVGKELVDFGFWRVARDELRRITRMHSTNNVVDGCQPLVS